MSHSIEIAGSGGLVLLEVREKELDEPVVGDLEVDEPKVGDLEVGDLKVGASEVGN